MSDESERATGTQGPLKYAPRAVREGEKGRAWTSNGVVLRPEVSPDTDDLPSDHPFPLREMRSPLVPPPPPPEPEPSGTMRSIMLPALAAVASALLVFAFYSGKLNFGSSPTPAPAPPRLASTESTQVIPARPSEGHVAPSKVEANASSPTLAAVGPQPLPAPAVRGVTDTEIRFGIAAPFSGSARELGRQMKLGIDTAFGMINAAGGINGRQLRLIAADDGYEPTRTTDAMKQLFEKDKIFGIVGNVGTPTATVALPYTLQQRSLFFGAFTGAG